ncbi:MAG: FAD-dependent oxidoreductase [Gammaproteobacteria bacterium]|nr:FAD-dependent oxidoreductase [Gammaproteobacteria bacterium]
MVHDDEVLVLGAGVVGLCAALSMAKRGKRVALLDKGDLSTAQDAAPLGRVYALNAASLSLLTSLGALEASTADWMTPYERMAVWVANRSAEIDFDSRLIGLSQLGVIASDAGLMQALFNQIKDHELISYYAKVSIHHISEQPDGVQLRDHQSSWRAPLALIADGAQSSFRKQLNLPVTQWSYHQDALITVVETTLPHRHCCYQVFLPDGPLAFLPLSHPHQCAIVWSTSVAQAKHLLALDVAVFNQMLTQQIRGRLGEVKSQGPCTRFPLTMRHTQQYVGKHWLLLGDAAHTIHPMAGLGLNVGLADLQCWLQQVDAGGLNRLTRALGAYQRERKAQVWQTILMLEGLKTMFSTPLQPLQMLRDIGLHACQKVPILKRLFIHGANSV